MATIDSLAPELLSEIFEQLSLQQLYKDLIGAALVCRRWRVPAQRALFQRVSLRYPRRRHWLDSPAKSLYVTRSLQFSNGSGVNVLDGGHEWCVGDGPDLSDIKSLSLMYPEHFPPDPAPLAFPNLRHLEVYVDAGQQGDDDDDDMLPLPTIEAIFTPFRQSLLSLRLRDLCSDIIASRLVKVLAGAEPFSHVRRLALENPQNNAFRVVCDILSAFPSLVSLELELSVGLYTAASEVVVVSELGRNAPSTLQVLILNSAGITDTDVITELLRIIKLPNLEGLRRLELPTVPKHDLASEEGLALLDECEKRSISILCRYGYLTRDMMDEDAVP